MTVTQRSTYWGKLAAFFLVLLAIMVQSETAQGQGTRSLRIWVDTLNLNLCEGTSFDNWGVWLESTSQNGEESTIGFRQQDSVLAVEISLRWDTSFVRLEPPYIVASPQTLFGRFPTKVQSVDTVAGQLYVSVSADRTLRTVVGTNIPLFYLRGRIRTTDTVVTAPVGGAKAEFLQIEGALGDNAGTKRFLPGFVQVVRDTTPEYTGTIQVSEGSLDTNHFDTINVSVDNFANRRVDRIGFRVVTTGGSISIVDTSRVGTLADNRAVTSSIAFADTTATFELESDSLDQLLSGQTDPVLIRLIVQRKTDSAFVATIYVTEIGVNRESCLGKLIGTAADVTGKPIVPADTVIDTAMSVHSRTQQSEIAGTTVWADRDHVEIAGSDLRLYRVKIYRVDGTEVAVSDITRLPDQTIVRFNTEIPRGMYFLVLYNQNGTISNKQFIQTR